MEGFVLLKKEIKENKIMDMKSMAIIFTTVILSLIVNFFQYCHIKHVEEREGRKDRLLYEYGTKIEEYKDKLYYVNRS